MIYRCGEEICCGQTEGVAVNNMSVRFLQNTRSGEAGDLLLYTRAVIAR